MYAQDPAPMAPSGEMVSCCDNSNWNAAAFCGHACLLCVVRYTQINPTLSKSHALLFYRPGSVLSRPPARSTTAAKPRRIAWASMACNITRPCDARRRRQERTLGGRAQGQCEIGTRLWTRHGAGNQGTVGPHSDLLVELFANADPHGLDVAVEAVHGLGKAHCGIGAVVRSGRGGNQNRGREGDRRERNRGGEWLVEKGKESEVPG